MLAFLERKVKDQAGFEDGQVEQLYAAVPDEYKDSLEGFEDFIDERPSEMQQLVRNRSRSSRPESGYRSSQHAASEPISESASVSAASQYGVRATSPQASKANLQGSAMHSGCYSRMQANIIQLPGKILSTDASMASSGANTSFTTTSATFDTIIASSAIRVPLLNDNMLNKVEGGENNNRKLGKREQEEQKNNDEGEEDDEEDELDKWTLQWEEEDKLQERTLSYHISWDEFCKVFKSTPGVLQLWCKVDGEREAFVSEEDQFERMILLIRSSSSQAVKVRLHTAADFESP